MSIKNFAVTITGQIHLRDAADELMFDPQGRPMLVNVYGPGSKQYAKAQAAQSNRMIDRMKRKGKTEQSAEDKASENAEFLSACTQSFENVEYDGLTGDALAKAIYSDQSIGFVADQVAKYIGDWANFKKPSPSI